MSNPVLGYEYAQTFIDNIHITMDEEQHTIDLMSGRSRHTRHIVTRRSYQGQLELEYRLDDDLTPEHIRRWQIMFGNHGNMYDIGMYKGVSMTTMENGLDYCSLAYKLRICFNIERIDDLDISGGIEPSLSTPCKKQLKPTEHFDGNLFEL